MTQYKWMLRKGGKKERCPQCGKMRFVPFVLSADGKTKAGAEYGRCDRETSCGYFRYPDRPVDTGKVVVRQPEPPKEPILMPAEVMHVKVADGNSLFRAYCQLMGKNWMRLSGAMLAYNIGTGSHGECIYYQFDGRYVRTAKAILYGLDGHRLKMEDGGLPVWWLHKSPAARMYTAGKELKQCLFGQHLIAAHPSARIYVVEAEKTAVMMAATDRRTFDERIWVAVGGSQMLKGAIDLMPLMGRDVTLVPDDGQYWNWKRTAENYGWNCVDIAPLKALHRLPDGCDIWDCKEDTLRKEAAK